MKLFFGNIENGKVEINDEEQQHIVKVLRMREGEEIFVTDGKGNLAKGNLVNLPMTEIHPDIWRQLLYHRNKWISPELKCVIKYMQEE